MAERAAIALALGTPVLAGLVFLGFGGAPLAYPVGNALALLLALPVAAFVRIRLTGSRQRVLTVLLLALLDRKSVV